MDAGDEEGAKQFNSIADHLNMCTLLFYIILVILGTLFILFGLPFIIIYASWSLFNFSIQPAATSLVIAFDISNWIMQLFFNEFSWPFSTYIITNYFCKTIYNSYTFSRMQLMMCNYCMKASQSVDLKSVSKLMLEILSFLGCFDDRSRCSASFHYCIAKCRFDVWCQLRHVLFSKQAAVHWQSRLETSKELLLQV